MDVVYVPVGIISKVAEDHKIEKEEAEVILRDEIKGIVELYNQGDALAFFDDIHRAALHCIGENELMPVTVFREVLRDLEICDSVLMQVKGILVRAYTAEKRTEFIIALQKFYESLQGDHLKLSLIDVFKTMKKHLETPPEKPNGNDTRLLSIIENAATSVPGFVNNEKSKLFQIDRITMISAMLDKLEANSKLERVNPWA